MSQHTFNPPDHELINHHLNPKITEEEDLRTEREISEVNLCHHEPAEIPALARMQSSHTWHIISPVERLKGRFRRTKRTTKTGSWKISGKSPMVKDVDGNIIGFKKYLVFRGKKNLSSYSSSSSFSSTGRQQNKSVWIIHEYHSSIQHPNKDGFVLCKLMKKTRAPRCEAIVEASPAAAIYPIVSPNQTPNDNNFVEDYGGDDWAGFQGFQSSDLLDQPPYGYTDYSHYFQNLEIDGNLFGGSF